jgi:CRISPR/Cas system-associated protein Cas10 (large subunit of type III CRISPR-Cas system)
MGTGIGKNCERCGNQLNYDDGFELKEEGFDYDLCKECASIVDFDKKIKANN